MFLSDPCLILLFQLHVFRLVGNPVCGNVQLQGTPYCNLQQDSTSSFSSVDCSNPYEGPIICRAPSFSDISNNLQPMWNVVVDNLNGTPVTYSLGNYFFDGNAYLQVELKICSKNKRDFTRSQILQWFDLNSQNLSLPEMYGPCHFNPSPYVFRKKGTFLSTIKLAILTSHIF